MDDINESIRNAKQQLEQMIDLNPEIMLLLDRDANIVRCNHAALTFLALPGYQDILGHSLGEFLIDAPSGFFDALLHSEEGYQSKRLTTALPSGECRELGFTTVNPGHHDDPIALIISDLTEEAKKLARTEQTYKKETVQAITGALLHTLGQPLTVIMLRAQLIQLALERGNQPPDELKKSLQDIMTLSMDVAATLDRLGNASSFAEETYLEGVQMLDIAKASESPEENGTDAAASAATHALAAAMDAKLPGSGDHVMRTGELATLIALEMGLSRKEATVARQCGILHDIGKIGMPDALLMKPGRLTDEEMDTMRKHTSVGRAMLMNFPFFKNEAEVAYRHHERFDGTGYPDGLKGDAIPLYVRIATVADTFEAMRDRRAYKEPAKNQDAYDEILACAGTHFDPTVVEAFKVCYPKMIERFPVIG